MRTSVTGTSPTDLLAEIGCADFGGHRLCFRRPGRAAGFTLIEILVVCVIIGIVAAGIVLSVNLTGRDRPLEKEGQRLFTLIDYAREQAELQTREYGVMFRDDGYEFLTYDPRQAAWRSVTEDDALSDRKLPDGLMFKLLVETRPVVLARPKDAKDKTPQVMIFSNGDLTSFAATLERDGGVRSITVTENDKGQVVAQPMVEEKQP
jgi:general secretion pathway protein H